MQWKERVAGAEEAGVHWLYQVNNVDVRSVTMDRAVASSTATALVDIQEAAELVDPGYPDAADSYYRYASKNKQTDYL